MNHVLRKVYTVLKCIWWAIRTTIHARILEPRKLRLCELLVQLIVQFQCIYKLRTDGLSCYTWPEDTTPVIPAWWIFASDIVVYLVSGYREIPCAAVHSVLIYDDENKPQFVVAIFLNTANAYAPHDLTTALVYHELGHVLGATDSELDADAYAADNGYAEPLYHWLRSIDYVNNKERCDALYDRIQLEKNVTQEN